jgi:predicted ATP-grasp superfamily ATP-dependent carboligase
MAESLQLNNPRLVAVWPGMGHVALNAGVYLLAHLDMNVIAEFEASDLFDVEGVDVKAGIVQGGRRPRNRFFLWSDPAGQNDLVLFLGEAQPPVGKYAFCRQLAQFAKRLGVRRVVTFAAMASRMRPDDRARVFAAATDEPALAELTRLGAEPVEEGRIGGLNGVLLAAAAEAGMDGMCLLGEMPQVFTQLPFPKASLAVLECFTALTGIDVDLSELTEQSSAAEEQLVQLLERVEESMGEEAGGDEENSEPESEAPDEEPATPADRQHVERLFREAARERSKAFELKRELDRLGLFKDYEDRFLDLFKKPG